MRDGRFGELYDTARGVIAQTACWSHAHRKSLVLAGQVPRPGWHRVQCAAQGSGQDTGGRLAYVSPETLEHLRAWLSEAKIDVGYIFRAVRNQRAGQRQLHPFVVNRILKQAATAAELSSHEIERLSGHSMRVGAAQDMIVSGLSILPIMQAGGWRSMNAVGRYVENANPTAFGTGESRHAYKSLNRR